MKVLKKIGVGIISLGLISTFYIPEAKANKTIYEWKVPSGKYAVKTVNRSGKIFFLLEYVGSGISQCVLKVVDENGLKNQGVSNEDILQIRDLEICLNETDDRPIENFINIDVYKSHIKKVTRIINEMIMNP